MIVMKWSNDSSPSQANCFEGKHVESPSFRRDGSSFNNIVNLSAWTRIKSGNCREGAPLNGKVCEPWVEVLGSTTSSFLCAAQGMFSRCTSDLS